VANLASGRDFLQVQIVHANRGPVLSCVEVVGLSCDGKWLSGFKSLGIFHRSYI
jgi:hypothetical protein